MTNGEKLKEVFPDIQIFNVTENELGEKFIHIRLEYVCQAIELEWWNAEYKESITKNGISNKSIIYKAKESKKIQEDLDKLSELNKTATKNDLGVDCISRQAINRYIDYILSHDMGKKKSFDFIKKIVANLPSETL